MSANAETQAGLSTVSVIIAAYSMRRWADLRAAVASAQAQTMPPLEIIVVIDYNPGLCERARRGLPGTRVLANTRAKGASGARNTGVAASRGQVVAFLDDDACASPEWLEALLCHFGNPRVVGVGGRLIPLWASSRPCWFPPEFDWTVGASYRGMPEIASTVRNVWSGNMVIRRGVFDAVGGFREGFGKLGGRSRPEDTDLCLRATAPPGAGIWMYEPAGLAGHRVPSERATLGYFLSRCVAEGGGKAALAALNGVTESTSMEREYTRRVLPRGFARGLRDAAAGHASGALRSLAIAAGFSCAAAGFLGARYGGVIALARGRRQPAPRGERAR